MKTPMSFGEAVIVRRVLEDVAEERRKQHLKWGKQNHPDGTADELHNRDTRAMAQTICDDHARDGRLTYADILTEELAEVLCETEAAKLRAELIQVAAVAVAWVEAIDRRGRR